MNAIKTYPAWYNQVLKQSGLTHKDAERLHWECVTGLDRLVELLGYPPELEIEPSGLWIPYLDMDGRPIDGRGRFRFTTPQYFNKNDQLEKKPRKYTQRKGHPACLYVPPETWSYLEKNPDGALVVTEGEKKAACAAKMGIPAAAFGGVFYWKERDAETLTGETQSVLKGRMVFLVYDSDYNDTPDKQRQFAGNSNRLAPHLKRIEATLVEVVLPKLNDYKTGLDDYLVQGCDLMDLFQSGEYRLVEPEAPLAIPREIMSDSQALKVYLFLLANADPNHVATASVKTISEGTSLSEKQVRNAMKKLGDLDLVSKKEGHTTSYYLPKGKTWTEAGARLLASNIASLGKTLEAKRARLDGKGQDFQTEKGETFSLKTDQKGQDFGAEKGKCVVFMGEEERKNYIEMGKSFYDLGIDNFAKHYIACGGGSSDQDADALQSMHQLTSFDGWRVIMDKVKEMSSTINEPQR